MRIAALYDIHGNAPALEAVLAVVGSADIDQVVVGGDVVPGPMPTECFTQLEALTIPLACIHGNGERAILEQRSGTATTLVPPSVLDAVRWVAAEIAPGAADAIRAWPSTYRIQHPVHGRLLFCHATPRNDTEIFTRQTPSDVLRPIFDAAESDVVICGHTHMQFDRMIGDTRVLNAGSVGMPFGAPGAYWLLIDDDGIALQCTPYDFAAAAGRIQASAYPGATAFAQHNVLSPPGEATILAAYERAELRG